MTKDAIYSNSVWADACLHRIFSIILYSQANDFLERCNLIYRALLIYNVVKMINLFRFSKEKKYSLQKRHVIEIAFNEND